MKTDMLASVPLKCAMKSCKSMCKETKYFMRLLNQLEKPTDHKSWLLSMLRLQKTRGVGSQDNFVKMDLNSQCAKVSKLLRQ